MNTDPSYTENSTQIAIYRPRPVQALPNWEPDQWIIKPYEISFEADENGKPVIPSQLWAAAHMDVLKHLRTAKLTNPAYGAGFTVLHRSASGTWLLTAWWAYDNILCTGLSHAPTDETTFARYKGPIRACVHELAVVEHERQVWIKTMMTGQPDLQLWSSKRLEDDVC